MPAARILRLSLSNYRNYRAAGLDCGGRSVVLVGANGAGKTNLIEAVSFLAPGRGLRRATLEDVAFYEGDGSWAVSAEIEGAFGLATLGTGIEPPSPGENTASRKCRIDREPVPSANAFTDHLRVIWLTPDMDGLFAGPASGRRYFLDKLVAAVDTQHRSRVSALERSLRSRNRLLEERSPDTHWLDAIERETAELAVAIAALRAETVLRLQGVLRADAGSAFPFAAIALAGWMEELALKQPSAEIEERYRSVLRENRPRDAAAGRTLDGPHLTDLSVIYGPKSTPAADASTGEQKALLIRLVLAHARLLADMTGFAPVLLLDEIVAHLDPGRRKALFDELSAIGSQVFMTGADPAAFAEIAGRARVFEVTAGAVGAVTA